ncbi:MAG TPA: galactokinase [Ktedonobacterales bacterium]|nr:galactokinase [Ktedonobacterales bacterium]
MREIERRATAAYRARFGATPEVVTSAPGRVNLIGEHTDYNGGYVLPCAIDRRTAVALGRGDGPFYSADFDDARPRPGPREGAWVDYPRGVAWALAEAGMAVPAFQAAFAGDVPQGAGLSSSAAIEAATVLALDALGALGLARTAMAQLCQRAENQFVGVQSGIMDQYASLLGQAGQALLVDCRSLASEAVPLDLAGAGLSLLVCDTGVKRGLAATGYNDRRATCERAATRLGLRQLRDATLADLAQLSGEELLRARHVVTENARVLAAVTALRQHDFAAFGALMYASHASLRDDYAVSTPELDAVVATARAAGAPGARLTGAGFGGCAIALTADPAALARAITDTFAARGYHPPTCYVFVPAAGAEVISDAHD